MIVQEYEKSCENSILEVADIIQFVQFPQLSQVISTYNKMHKNFCDNNTEGWYIPIQEFWYFQYPWSSSSYFPLFQEGLLPFDREGNGNPLQYSCLESSMDGGAQQATVHGVAENQTRLSNFTSFTSLSLYFITGEGNGSPLQYSYLENPMDRGAWRAVVHGVAESRT